LRLSSYLSIVSKLLCHAQLLLPVMSTDEVRKCYSALDLKSERLANIDINKAEEVSEESDIGSDSSDDEEEPIVQDSHKWSRHPRFQTAAALIIVINTAIIALEAAFIQHEAMKPYFNAFEYTFTVIYVVEVSVRMWEDGFHSFFCTGDVVWNLFDLSVTAAGVFDSAMEVLLSSQGSGASVCRLFRIMRIMRLFRAMKFLKEVEVVLITAGKATLKLGVLVFLVVFVSAIVVTNLLWDADNPKVSSQFENLATSMWSMFVLMTIDNWTTRIDEVMDLIPAMRIFYILFVFCASIALMSLVPAIFIELNMTEREREEEKARLKQKKLVKKKHRVMCGHLFNICDDDKNGRVSVQEMQAVIEDENMLRRLQDQGLAQKGDFRDIKYGLFDLWKHYLAETGDQEATVGKREFAESVLKARTDMTDAHLWRCITAAHLEVHELADAVKPIYAEASAIKDKSQQTCRQASALQVETFGLRSELQGVKAAVATTASTIATAAVDASSTRWYQALERLAQKQEDSVPIAQAAAAGASAASAAAAEAALAKCIHALGQFEVAHESNANGKQEKEPLKLAYSQNQTLQDKPGSSENASNLSTTDIAENMSDDNDGADKADETFVAKKNGHMDDYSKNKANTGTPEMETNEVGTK